MHVKFGDVAELAFPSRCLRCKENIRGGNILCADCFAAIPIHTAPFCGRCGNRLPEFKKICHPAMPYLLGAAGDYQNETVRNLIHALKFNGVRDAALPLAELIIQYLSRARFETRNFAVVAIPLHTFRERDRGFNQSEHIAAHLARRLGAPLISGILLRRKRTAPQSELGDHELRKENMRDAFSAEQSAAVRNANLFLVDDVTTSGATFFEAARTLKAAGARKIIALAAARA